MCAPPPAAQKHLPAAFYKVAQAILAAMTHEKHCAPPRANRVASSPHQGSPKLLAPVRRRGLFLPGVASADTLLPPSIGEFVQ